MHAQPDACPRQPVSPPVPADMWPALAHASSQSLTLEFSISNVRRGVRQVAPIGICSVRRTFKTRVTHVSQCELEETLTKAALSWSWSWS